MFAERYAATKKTWCRSQVVTFFWFSVYVGGYGRHGHMHLLVANAASAIDSDVSVDVSANIYCTDLTTSLVSG